MITLDQLKSILNTLPISGDIVEKENDNEIIYCSKRVLPLNKQTEIKQNYKVRSIRHEFCDETQKLKINIDHFKDSGHIQKTYEIVIDCNKFLKKLRDEKIDNLNTISEQS